MEFPYQLPPESESQTATLYPSLLPHSPAAFPPVVAPNRFHAPPKRHHEPESPSEELSPLEALGRTQKKRFKSASLTNTREFEPAFASLSLLAPTAPAPVAPAHSALLDPATLPRIGHSPLPITPPMQQGEQHASTLPHRASNYPLPPKLSSHQSYDTPYDTTFPSHPVPYDSPDFLGTLSIQQTHDRNERNDRNEYGLGFGLGLIKDLSLGSPTPPAPRRITRHDSPIHTTGKQKTRKKIKEIKMKASYERAPGIVVVTSLDDSSSSSSEPEVDVEELEPITAVELHPRMISPAKQSLLDLITPSLSNDILQEIMRGEGKRQEEMGLVLWKPLVLGKLAPTPSPAPSSPSYSPISTKLEDVEEEFVISELRPDEMEVETDLPIPEPLIIDLDDEAEDSNRGEGLSTVLEEELEQIKARGGVGVPDPVWGYGLGVDPVGGMRVNGAGEQEDEVMMELD